jgi:predicted choloylglycine hydrolase
MGLLKTTIPQSEFKGSPRACGRAYGKAHAEAIAGFLHMETPPDKKRLKYARECWNELKKWNRSIAEFVRGSAEGAKHSVEEMTLILLHEEIVHTKNCTGVGATRTATADGKAVIGQNWDWNSRLYPWSSIMRLKIGKLPEMLTYAYPGLWASAGINEHGMSLVWTGAGYAPKVRPRAGIPTYALIAGILSCRNCKQALELIRRTRNAGCFVFFIADAEGEVCVVEGSPHKTIVVRCEDTIGRANHYECPAMVRRSKQALPPIKESNTLRRARRLKALLKTHRGRIGRKHVEAMLSDENEKKGMTICQTGPHGITIDSFYCLPAKREMWLARGVPSRHEFRRFKV